MAIDIKISGVTVSALDDYSISESVGNISSSTITVHVTSGVPQPMQKVEFYIGAVKYFTGLIEDVSSPTWDSKHTVADYSLSITSIETILNNRRVTGSWKNKLAHEIVSDLITDYLLDEGLTAGSISVTDKSYDNYNCEGTRLSEVLDELSRDTGASYYINSALAFNFVIPADYPTVTVPTDINEISENIEANDLVTVQTVMGAQKETEEQAESILSWTGTYWDLQFQVTTITGMTINGAIAQHGIKDIDTDPSITFWYEVGSRRITLNPSATFIPDEGDLVACLYKGYLNITATETNNTLIAQLQTLNGTSGRIEAVHNDESILTFTDAYNKAVELLAKSGEVTKTVTLKTHSLTASALNNKWVLNLTDAKISGTYYVIARTITRFANEFECTVTLKNKSADLRPGSSLYKSTKSTNTAVNTSTTKPDTVADCVAIARENYIELSCNKVAQELNNTLKWYRWEIKKTIAGDWSGASIVLTDTNSGQYVFDRGIDGYPEASDLAGWSVRVMAVDIYGNDADNYSNVTGIVTTTYGTWIPTAPALSPYASKRDFTVSIAQGSSARQIYGDIVYRAEIKRYDEVDYYKPNLTADPYESEENYKDGTGFVTVTSYIQQRVPLENQATDPQSTSYTYRFTTVNATTGIVGASATVTLIASASTAQDIVNKSMDAEKLNVQDLAAVSTVFGSIRSDGIAKDSTNFWNLSDPSSALGYGQEGEMCVGTSASVEGFDPVTNPAGYKDTDSFFHFIPSNTGSVLKGLYLKLANFLVTAISSTITGLFEVVQRQTAKTIFKVDDESEYTSGIQTETSTTLVDDDTPLTDTIIDKLTKKSVVINSTAYHLVPDEPILLIQDLSTGIETQVVTPILFKGIHNIGGVLHAIGAGDTYSYVSDTWTQIPIDWISTLVVSDETLSFKYRNCCAIKDNFLYIPTGGTVLEVVDLTTFTVQNKTLSASNRFRRCCAIKDNFLYIPIEDGTVLEVVDLTTFTVQDKVLSASNRGRQCCAIKDNFLYIPIRYDTVLEVVDLTTFTVQDKPLSYRYRYCCVIKDNSLYIPISGGRVLEVVDLTTFTVQDKTLSAFNRGRRCCAIKDNFLYIPIYNGTVLEVVDLTTFTVQDKVLSASNRSRNCCVIKDNFLYILIESDTALEVVDLTTFTVQNKTLSASNRSRNCCVIKDNFLYIPINSGTVLEVVAGLPYLQHKTTTNNTTHILSTSSGVIETIKASDGEYVGYLAPDISGSPLAITIGAISFFPDFTTGKITKYNAGTITTVNTTARANIKTLITDGTNMFISGLGNVIYKVAQDGTQTALALSQLSNSMYHTLGIIGTKMYVIPETSSPRFAEVNLSTFALIQYALFSPSWGALRGEGFTYDSKYWLAEKNTKKQHRLEGIKEALSNIKTLKPIGSGFVERTVDTNGNSELVTADGDVVHFLSDNQLRDGISTIRASASFTLDTYPDGKKLRIANTHATNTITCTLPSGQTMNGQSSFTIAPDTLLGFELIGTAWKSPCKKTKTRTIICIGDSYNLTTEWWDGWGDVLKTKVSSGVNVYSYEAGGGGFVANSYQHTFLSALQSASGDPAVYDKESITDIVVLGDYNDMSMNVSEANLDTAIEEFMEYCRVNYPNARVIIGGIGVDFNSAVNQGKLNTYADYYEKLGAKHGARTCPNFRHILKNRKKLFFLDGNANSGFHPSTYGNGFVADCVLQFLESGYFDVKDGIDCLGAYIYQLNGNIRISARPYTDATHPRSSFLSLELRDKSYPFNTWVEVASTITASGECLLWGAIPTQTANWDGVIYYNVGSGTSAVKIASILLFKLENKKIYALQPANYDTITISGNYFVGGFDNLYFDSQLIY